MGFFEDLDFSDFDFLVFDLGVLGSLKEGVFVLDLEGSLSSVGSLPNE